MDRSGGALGSQLVAGLRAADKVLGCAGQAPVWRCGDDDLEAGLELLDRLEAQTVALRGALLAQAEQRSLKERTGAPSTERWLADRFRWSRVDARRKLAAARAQARQPVVAEALTAGVVTVEQAAVLAAGLDRIDQVPGASVTDRAEAAG